MEEILHHLAWDVLKNPANHGKNYQKLNWWVYRISEPSTVSKRVFLLRLPAASIMCIKICLCYLDKTWAENYGKKDIWLKLIHLLKGTKVKHMSKLPLLKTVKRLMFQTIQRPHASTAPFVFQLIALLPSRKTAGNQKPPMEPDTANRLPRDFGFWCPSVHRLIFKRSTIWICYTNEVLPNHFISLQQIYRPRPLFTVFFGKRNLETWRL